MRVSSTYIFYDKHIHINSRYPLLIITSSFRKEKNIIYINLYDSNECLVYKRTLTKNILEIIF